MNNLLRLGLAVFVPLIVWACESQQSYSRYSGNTMGTSYNISCSSKASAALHKEIKQLLQDINMSVSTYIPQSSISTINQDQKAVSRYRDAQDSILVYVMPADTHFIKNFSISKKYHNRSKGFFDPSIMPLVNYWGFGYTEKKAVEDADSNIIEALVDVTDYTKWVLSLANDTMTIRKPKGAQLDFSAVAKGYAVDCIAEMLDRNGIADYMVEIGGEVRTKGVNNKSKSWVIGLSKPEIDARLNTFSATIELDNKAMASSGNYRNYYMVDGKSYGHEINPNTGYPEINRLLGVSAISEECAVSDAMATAFMVMGLERSIEWLKQQSEIKAVLFYQDDSLGLNQYISPGLPINILNQ